MSAAILAQAPLLMVATPFVAAALVALSPSGRLGWLIATVSAAVSVWLSAAFAVNFFAGAAVATHPAFAPDGIGVASAAGLAIASALAIAAAAPLLKDYQARARSQVLALCLCVGGGWTAALLARDLVGAFLAGEAAWLAAVALVALGAERERASLNGALRMLVAGGVGGVLFLLGAALIVRAAGTGEFAALPLAQIEAPIAAAAGVALMLAALAIKAGAAPFHAWFSVAMGRSAPLAALVLSCLGVVGSLALLTRIAAFASPSPALGEAVAVIAAAIGGLGIVVGSLQAIGAVNIHRLIAYACVAQGGCLLLGVALGSPAGFSAALIQLAALAAASVALQAGVVASGCGASIAALDGLGRRAPFSGVAITMGALSLMGAPLTLGFLGRWRIIEATLGVEWWWAAGLVIFASLAGAVYAGRLIERLYFRRAASVTPLQRDPWRLAFAPALLVGVGAIAMGVEPSLLLRLVGLAGGGLAGAAP